MSEVATRLVEEFYDGTAERDWPAWATEAVAILERMPALNGTVQREHIDSLACWCEPTVEHEDEDVRVIVHRRKQ